MKIPKVTLIIWTSNYYSSAYKQEVQAVRVNIDRFEGRDEHEQVFNTLFSLNSSVILHNINSTQYLHILLKSFTLHFFASSGRI